MAIVERSILMRSKDASGNQLLYYPITTVDNVDGAMADVPVTAADAGKFLRVNSAGVWAAEHIPDAESASF